MKIAALVSGGVDSSVMLYLLMEQAYQPDIFYIRISMEDELGVLDDCTFREDLEIVMSLAKKYNCRFHIADLHHQYWQTVVHYTIETVKSGKTPNPDILCNKWIKFGLFDEKFGKDYDILATGHYASVTEINGEKFLATARDKRKDQTYFLSGLNGKQVARISFPLANLLKKEVRQIASQQQLPSAERPDSQGICFLGKINYRQFLKRYLGTKKGLIVEAETGKIMGSHEGYWFYTIGQRHGLGLGQGPWYVSGKNTQENIIFITRGLHSENLKESRVYLEDFHFINNNLTGFDLENIKFKIRHTPEFTAGKLFINSDMTLIESSMPIVGLAPGQYAAVYDKNEHICLGSGIITSKP